MKKALIFGITGQDGSYLAELLLIHGYEVHGVIRRSSTSSTSRIDHLLKDVILHYGDITDASQVVLLFANIKPDEVYNLAAQSDVRISFDQPSFTTQVNGMGVLGILEAVRINRLDAKIYQACTSEMYGGVNCPLTGYTEQSPFSPKSPYAIAKLYAYWMVKSYRESYNMFACNGILFNHESTRRGLNFVTKKVVNWCSAYYKHIRQGAPKPAPLELGNLDAYRDWGHAKDYVYSMYLIMNALRPDDWVVATGETHSVREFVERCFSWMNIKITWEGHGVAERGRVNNETVITINSKLFRPSEVNALLGDSTKIRKQLAWQPRYNFDALVAEMMRFEVHGHLDCSSEHI